MKPIDAVRALGAVDKARDGTCLGQGDAVPESYAFPALWTTLEVNSMRILYTTLFLTFLLAAPKTSQAFDVTGGRVWEDRVGPGIGVSLGLNGCAGDYCDRVWGTGAGFGSTVGFYWRVIPNLVVFGDFHFGHLSVHAADPYFREWDVHNENGFVFQTTGGAEFHLPITNWVAPYAGMGIGFAYLGVWGDDYRHRDYRGFHYSLRGVDFQLRFGADFYPFRKVPNLGLGPMLHVGIPAWITACWEEDWDGVHRCDDPDSFVHGDIRFREGYSPAIVYFGAGMRYGF